MKPLLAWVAGLPLLFLLFPSCGAGAAPLRFAGALQRVGDESISIRLADGRLIDARLPKTPELTPQNIVTHYKVGDQVQITCERIQPVWEQPTYRFQYLELVELRFLRIASPIELSKVLATGPWLSGGNFLIRPAVEQPSPAATDRHPAPPGTADSPAQDKLEHAREVNMAYSLNLPNFEADETAQRYISRPGSTQWEFLDNIESEIAFRGGLATRQRIRTDGIPWDKPFQALPGFTWYGGFGTEIRPVFDPDCPTILKAEKPRELHGKQVQAYRFSSPPDGCFAAFNVPYQRFNPARTGQVLVEDPGGSVVQLEEEATGFPEGFTFVQRNQRISWDYVQIGDSTHLLPVGADFTVHYATGQRWRVIVRYTNHRHFESTANITFH